MPLRSYKRHFYEKHVALAKNKKEFQKLDRTLRRRLKPIHGRDFIYLSDSHNVDKKRGIALDNVEMPPRISAARDRNPSSHPEEDEN